MSSCTETSPTEGIDGRALRVLSLGHLGVDFAQGAIPALIVFFQPRFDLGYMSSAAIVLAATCSSSLTQPIFGALSDRRGALWLLPAGVALAGVGLGAAVCMPSYAALLTCVAVSAVGVGAFHPEGAKYARFASRGRHASSISVFSVGGNVGLALGPIIASVVVLGLGLTGGVLLALPGLAIAGALLHERRHLGSFTPDPRLAPETVGPSRPRSLALLLVIVALRSVAFYGLLTFVPLWEVANGQSRGHGALLLSLLLVAGAIGTVVIGPVADRIGSETVLRITMIATGPLIAIYVLAGGLAGAIAVIAAGAVTVGTLSTTTVLAQEYLPTRIGMASGLSMGFSIGLGGVAAFLLGAIADAVDLRVALLCTVGATLIGALLTFGLPIGRPLLREAAVTP